MNKEEKRALEELLHDLKEHNLHYALSYEDKCYEAIVKLQQELERYKNIVKETIEKSRCIFEDKTINDDEAFYQLGCIIDKLENVIGGETNE